jgi:hypothetical protein
MLPFVPFVVEIANAQMSERSAAEHCPIRSSAIRETPVSKKHSAVREKAAHFALALDVMIVPRRAADCNQIIPKKAPFRPIRQANVNGSPVAVLRLASDYHARSKTEKKTSLRDHVAPESRNRNPRGSLGSITNLPRELLAHVGDQRHESRPFDRLRYGVLADGLAAALPPAQDLPLAIREFLQQLHVFIIDVGGARTLAVNENRILLLGLDLRFRPALADLVDLQFSRHSMFL